VKDRPAGSIPLSNQSAMGLYLFAWTEDGRACSVMWGRGAAAPMFTYRSETAGRDITVPIVNPGRFGWPLPVPAGRQTPTPKVFQGFVQRYAQALHAETPTTEEGAAEPAEEQGALL
jgi:hypothetical protein